MAVSPYNRAMRRRSFLAAIAAAFVAPDPEKLLWVPKRKVISIPAPRKVELATPVALEAIVEDVTTHSSVWREMIVTGYVVSFSDGSTQVVTPSELPLLRTFTLLNRPRQRFNRAS